MLLAVEPQDLRAFLTVVDAADLAAAAGRLGLQPRELDDRIRRMELSLGVSLLTRRSPTMAPTEAGRRLAARARTRLAGVEAPTPPRPASPARIGCVPELRLQRLQAFLGALHTHVDDLEASVVRLPSREQLARLRAGDLDLAIVHDAADGGDLETHRLFDGERLAVLLPAGHVLRNRPWVAPSELTGETLLAPRRADDALDHPTPAQLEAAGLRFRHVVEVAGGHPRDVALAVAAHHGIAVVGAPALEAIGTERSLVTLRRLEPALWMPDTRLAWREAERPGLARLVAGARAAAREFDVGLD